MDIRSLGNAVPSGQQIVDKVVGAEPSAALGKPAAAPVITENAVDQAAKVPSLEEVTKAVGDINKSIQSLGQNLEFTVDKDSNKVVVKVVDLQTKAVLRQIPSEEALEISKSLDKLQGILIKQQA